MHLRLRTKLILAYLLPVLAVSLVAGSLAQRAAQRALEDELGRRLSNVAQALAGYMSMTSEQRYINRLDDLRDPEYPHRTRLNELLSNWRGYTETERVFVVAPNLDSLLDTDSDMAFGSPRYELETDRAELTSVLEGSGQSAYSVLFTDAAEARYMTGYAPIQDGEGQVVAVLGVTGSARFFSTLDGFRAALWILGAIVLLVVIAISVIVGHQLTRPISRLVAALRRFGRGDLREPVKVRSRDEIGFLAEAFNEMRGRLDQRDEQMQLMLSGIAHEVRNPLAGMELFCNLLHDELDEQPEQQDHVVRITRELDYLARVVNDFLRYARRRPLSPERFAFAPLLAEISPTLEPICAELGVKLVVSIEEGLELTGEREALRGVFANLIQNAAQASQPGGEVTLFAVSKNQSRYVTVSDRGKGMDKETVEKIFEPFFTTRQKGTGLGLALCRKTIDEHNGTVEVESALGQGTSIVVTLPFDEALHPLVHEPDFDTSNGEDDFGMEMIG